MSPEPGTSNLHRNQDGLSPKLYYLKHDLLQALQNVGAKFKPYTVKEIYTLLKNYLVQNQSSLRDPSGSSYVNCEGTPLGKAFNVARFHQGDIRNLLEKNVALAVFVDTTIDQSIFSSQSKSSNSDDLSTEKAVENFIDLSLTIPQVPDSDSGTESVYTYQGYETAVCQTESDDDSDSALYATASAGSAQGCRRSTSAPRASQEDEGDAVEYELASSSDSSSDRDRLNDSDSEGEDPGVVFILDPSADEDDVESCFADQSDYDSEAEDEAHPREAAGSTGVFESGSDEESGRWKCLMCGLDNRTFMRYCEKCWQLRKDWYPDPPKRRRKRRQKGKTKSTSVPRRHRSKSSSDSRSTKTEWGIENGASENRLLGASPPAVGILTASPPAVGILTELPPALGIGSDEDCDDGAARAIGKVTRDVTLHLYRTVSCEDGKTSEDFPVDLYRNGTAESSSSQTTLSSVDLDHSAENQPSSFDAKKRKLSEASECRGVKALRPVSPDLAKARHVSRKFRKFLNTSRGQNWVQSSDLLDLMECVSPDDSDSSSDSDKGLCRICYVRPQNASIIHGKLAHLGFCYTCVRKCYKSKQRCPICRRKINMITRNSCV